MEKRKTVGILIFDQVEVLDFCGPFEVFSVTRLDESRRMEEPSPFQVALVAERDQPVVTTGKMRVLPEYVLENCPALDILVVPGGLGTRREISNTKLLEWIKQRAKEGELLTSVCTGALLLAEAHLLDGLRATTHWAYLEPMRQRFSQVKVESRYHWVEDGNAITSAGISAGIDMALRVVARYFGETVARKTAERMEYPYPESNARRVSVRA
jgi:transcriptional regulator GlxA family with amidase domain